jgi:hypothetical protein
MSNAFAKHSDILLKYELQAQLSSDNYQERSPDSEQKVNKEVIPDTEQQEGPEQSE